MTLQDTIDNTEKMDALEMKDFFDNQFNEMRLEFKQLIDKRFDRNTTEVIDTLDLLVYPEYKENSND